MKYKIRTAFNSYSISIRRIINVNGVKMELKDLYDTLEELNSGPYIYITDKEMVKVLKALKVVTYGGSKDSPATPGENFKEFLNTIRERYYDLLDEQRELTEKYNAKLSDEN